MLMELTGTPARIAATDVVVGDVVTEFNGRVTEVGEFMGQVKLSTTAGLAYYKPTAKVRVLR